MSTMQVDTSPFTAKTGHKPERKRKALWRFRIEEDEVSFWGTMGEALSTARLYALIEDIPNARITLLDYEPLPRVLVVASGPEG